MAELRAPDPTLSAHEGYVGVMYVADVPVAHRPGGCTDKDDLHEIAHPEYARWFAVPCRECFTEAPRHGRRVVRGAMMSAEAILSGASSEEVADPHLSWQVREPEQARGAVTTDADAA